MKQITQFFVEGEGPTLKNWMFDACSSIQFLLKEFYGKYC